MITITLHLVWGNIVKGKFEEFDSCDFAFAGDTINDWLNEEVDKACNYAELYLEIPELYQKKMIGTFTRLGRKSNSKWVLV